MLRCRLTRLTAPTLRSAAACHATHSWLAHRRYADASCQSSPCGSGSTAPPPPRRGVAGKGPDFGSQRGWLRGPAFRVIRGATVVADKRQRSEVAVHARRECQVRIRRELLENRECFVEA